MGNLEQLKRRLSERKKELSKNYGIRQIGIFGSYARGEQTESSDLDVLVDLDENSKISLLDFVHAENELTDFLGIKVDLVMKDSLKPGIGIRILKEVVYL
jgi:predicted nucleotidyltransferase